MINNISEGTIRTAVKIESNAALQEKQMVLQKAKEVRQDRPIENSDPGGQTESRDPQANDTKYLLEDNTLIFEKYNKDGDLILRIPPTHKPLDERV